MAAEPLWMWPWALTISTLSSDMAFSWDGRATAFGGSRTPLASTYILAPFSSASSMVPTM